MNVDRGQTSFTDEEIADLRTRVAEYKAFESLSWDKLGGRVGVPGGTLSQWVPNKYAGDNGAIAAKVNKFFLAEDERETLEREAPIVPGFLFTKTARRIHSQLRWAQRGKIVLIIGQPGVGKTASLKQYREATPNVIMAALSPMARSPSAMMIEILGAADGRMERKFGASLQSLFHTLADRIADRRALIVLDDAQHASDLALEQLRALHDMTGVGVALAGNPTVLTRIQGVARQAAFAQLYSRVSLVGVYDKPDTEDLAIMFGAWGVTHALERRFLEGLAGQPGCLRTLTQVMELATLTAQQDEEERTLDHMKYAWHAHARQGVAAAA